jgi:hypothetical protein
MFTMKIVDSDAFLDMPLSTQCLYFHLNMRADDDGFISNPKRIKRLIGASDDDLKLLVAKRFVLEFDDGVIVIKHWRMHNTIQKDRYTPTAYQDELSLLGVKQNKAYSLTEGEIIPLETKCIQNVSTDIDKELDIGLEEDLGKRKSKKPQVVYYPTDDLLNQAFTDYVKMRKELKKPMTERAVQLAMTKLETLSAGDNDKAIKILEQSIERSWAGLFELKDGKQGGNKTGGIDWDAV